MRGRSGVCVSAKRASQDAWLAPLSNDGTGKHVRYIWIKRGGTGGNSGSGATGYKAKPSHLLQRHLADRPGAAEATRARQERQRLANTTPPVLTGGYWGLDKRGQRTGTPA